MPALLHRHPQDVATVSVSASLIAPHSSNSRHMPRSRPAACAAAWSLSSADPGASDVHCILPSPDAARLPHLQQLARGADRRLLIGSATLAVAGLALALRGPQVVAAACMAAAALPALWLAGPLAGRSIARNGLAVLVALQLALACAIVGLSPALPIAVLLGCCSAIAIVCRCGWPAASARSRCWYRRRRVLRCGRRCCRPRCSRADPVPRPGRAACASRPKHWAMARVGLPHSHAISPRVPILGHMPMLAPMHRVRWPTPWPTLRATCRPSGDGKPRRMPRTRRSARRWMRRAPR